MYSHPSSLVALRLKVFFRGFSFVSLSVTFSSGFLFPPTEMEFLDAKCTQQEEELIPHICKHLPKLYGPKIYALPGGSKYLGGRSKHGERVVLKVW
jgi:hypothetical protein